MFGARPLMTLALLAAPAVAGDIPWSPSYEDALDRAEKENKVVFVAANMDGELANDRLASGVYKDKRIAELAAGTINLIASRFDHGSKDRPCKRFGSVTCTDHRGVEKDVRQPLLSPDAKGHVIAPQHVFLKPDGEVILSVAYEIDSDELQWCFVTALLAVDSACGVEMPADARAPRRLSMKGVETGVVSIRPLSKDELEEAIKQLRAGLGALGEADAFDQILATDDPAAVEYATKELERGYLAMVPQMQLSTIRTIGATSPASFWKAVHPFLDSKSEPLRNEVVVAMEQLGAPKSVRFLKAAFTKDKSPLVKKNALRALGAAGAQDKGARQMLLKQAGGKDPLLRRNALLALAWHAGDKKANEALLAALEVDDALERQAAALALAMGRRTEHRDLLQRVADTEPATEDTKVIERAVSVLDGANLSAIAADVATVGEDVLQRPRFFGLIR